MNPEISVVICSYNPIRNYINRTLDALKHQILPYEKWELILVDNASTSPLASEIDLHWHPNAKHILESTLGLTRARQAGIKTSCADIIVFVDDDNILEPDYLENVLEISIKYSTLGAWGGQIRAEFEVLPPGWAKPYLPCLAIREFEQDKWSNLLHQHETTPCGAGLCVRKIVADHYVKLVQSDPKRLELDRKGNTLTSCGDSDLAFTACDIGLGTGQFVALKLTHLMPASRLEEEYLLRLFEGIVYSDTVLCSLRGKLPSLPKTSLIDQMRHFYRLLKMSSRERRFYRAYRRGLRRAIQEII